MNHGYKIALSWVSIMWYSNMYLFTSVHVPPPSFLVSLPLTPSKAGLSLSPSLSLFPYGHCGVQYRHWKVIVYIPLPPFSTQYLSRVRVSALDYPFHLLCCHLPGQALSPPVLWKTDHKLSITRIALLCLWRTVLGIFGGNNYWCQWSVPWLHSKGKGYKVPICGYKVPIWGL